MSGKKTNNKKLFIIIILAVFLIVATIALFFLLKRDQVTSESNSGYDSEYDFKYEGWIDCQPVLSPEKEELCRRAEAANYPYIAY